jgi:hypothetical protein
VNVSFAFKTSKPEALSGRIIRSSKRKHLSILAFTAAQNQAILKWASILRTGMQNDSRANMIIFIIPVQFVRPCSTCPQCQPLSSPTMETTTATTQAPPSASARRISLTARSQPPRSACDSYSSSGQLPPLHSASGNSSSSSCRPLSSVSQNDRSTHQNERPTTTARPSPELPNQPEEILEQPLNVTSLQDQLHQL